MRSRSTGPTALLPMFAVAIVTLFTIEQLRLFVSGLAFGLREARGIPAEVVGLVGFAIMALTLVAVVFVTSVNRTLVTQLVVAIVVIRLLGQVVADPLLLIAISAAGVVTAGLGYPGLALVYGGRVLGVGLVMGGAFDVAVMAGRHTLDLPRSTSTSAFFIVFGLGVAAVGSLAWERQVGGFSRYGPAVPAAAAFAVGPWLAVHLTVTGNLGFVGSVTGSELPMAAAISAVGSMVALAWAAPGRSAPQPAIAGAMLLVVLLLLAGADAGWAGFLVFVGSVAAGGTVTGAFERETTAPPVRVGWGGGGGMVAGFFGLIVIYLPFAGIGAFSSAGLLPLLGVPLFIAGLACIPHQSTAAGRWVAPALVAAALLIVPVGIRLTEGSTGAEDQVALESMARIVESATPDIVALQEVSRGWVATGGCRHGGVARASARKGVLNTLCEVSER